MQGNLGARLVRNNFINKITALAEHSDRMKVRRSDDFTSVDSGFPSDTFNNIVWLSSTMTCDYAEPIQPFREKSFPVAIWLWDDLTNLEDSIHLDKEETNVAMIANLDEAFPARYEPGGFTIKEVTTAEELMKFSDVITSLFGESEEAIQINNYYHYLAASSLFQQPDMKFYIGKDSKGVVSTGMLVFTDETAGIYDLATREASRGRGYGSAMFHYLLQEAKARGSEYGVLQASEDGLNIYQKAGFRSTGTISVYEFR